MSTSQAQASKQSISIRGSAQLVAEFFNYSVNSILYQRGVYDPEKFKTVRQYGLPMQQTLDKELTEYLSNVTSQMETWLEDGALRKLVLVLTDVDSQEVIERWSFDVQSDEKQIASGKDVQHSEAVVRKEIAAIIRQITSSVSFLPLIEAPCTFDLLVYASDDCEVPLTWEDSSAKLIPQANQLQLRRFDTKIHQVATSVAYRAEDI